jgi:hypothetical protein
MTPFLKAIHNGYTLFIMNIIINLCKKKLMKMEVDMIKKIVFSKLGVHNAYRKIGSVRLQDRRFGKVCMNQE